MVTLTLNGGTYAGGSNTAMASAVGGVATFNSLVIDAAGSYALAASDGALAGVSSGSFTITPATAAKLAFLVAASTAMAGTVLNPAVQVAVQDAYGNTISTDDSVVTLTLTGGSFAGGSNTVMATAVNGVATFNNLMINTAGSYTLAASDGALAGATSNSFLMTPETIDLQVTNTPSSSSYAAGTNVIYTIVVSDAGPANVTGATVADTFPASLTGVTWTVTSSGGGTDTTHAPAESGNINDSVNLNSGGSITYTVTGTVPSSTAAGTLSDTATVTAPSGITDPNLANNTAVASAAITNVADLQITNTDNVGATVAGRGRPRSTR